MASGDVFSNMCFSTTFTAVQPAAGVSVLITFVACDSDNGRMGGNNSGALSYDMTFPNGAGGNTLILRNFPAVGTMKLFVTNTQYIYFSSGAGAVKFSYSGVEM